MDGTDVLAQICAYTRAEVARRKEAVPLNAIRHKLHQRSDPPRGFGAALTQTVAKGGFGLIAEIKQASPSGGMIRTEFDPPALAELHRQADGLPRRLNRLADFALLIAYAQGRDRPDAGTVLAAAREAAFDALAA